MAGDNQSHSNYALTNKSNYDRSNIEDVFHPYVTMHLGIHTFVSGLVFDVIYGLGCIANLLLVAYIIKYRRYRSPIFTVIMSLGMADASNCVASILWMTYRSRFALDPNWMCSVSTFLTFLSIFASNYSIAVISVIRFYQIVFPLSAHIKVTPRLMSKICSLVWINGFAIGVPFALFNGVIDLKDSRGDFRLCTYIGDQQQIYDAVGAIWVHFLPLVTTVVVHFVKHVIVRKQVASIQLSSIGETHGNVRESADTRAVVIVVVVYILTTLPMVCAFLALLFGKIDHGAIPMATEIINKIYFSNSAINPFIYAFAAHTVRRDILTMFMCKHPRNKQSA